MFSSKLSFVMTAVGAAVGLGNIFRFPALCLKYGSAYILVYIISLFAIGLPLMFSEIALGRKFGEIAPVCFASADKKGAPLGFMCSANAFIIMTYYCVLFSFVVAAATFSYKMFGASDTAAQTIFNEIIFPKNFSPVLLCFLIFSWGAVLFCFGGADRLGKISTASVIFASLIILSLSLFSLFFSPDAAFALFRFKVGVFTSPSFWLDSLSQVFFSLSLMVGILITYGACLDKKESIIKCSLAIAIFDLLISLAATLIFAFSGSVGEGGLLSSFSVYPKAFSALGVFSAPVCFLFYLSVGFLCLDSVFSYLKSAVGFFVHMLGGKEVFWAAGLSAVSALLGSFLLFGNGLKFLGVLDQKITPFLILLTGLFQTALFSRPAVKASLIKELNLLKKPKVFQNFFSLSISLFCPLVLLVLLFSQIFF